MQKKLKKIIFFILVFSFMILLFTISFAATYWYEPVQVLSVWSVDSGKHLDWSGSTQYSSNWNSGVNTWNNYKSGVIRKDTLTTINDVTISDKEFISDRVNARTTQHGTGKSSSTTIVFATSMMNQLSNTKRTTVCAHEIGHTLGLDENRSSTANIMYDDMTYNTSNNTLSNADKNNYDYMYDTKY